MTKNKGDKMAKMISEIPANCIDLASFTEMNQERFGGKLLLVFEGDIARIFIRGDLPYKDQEDAMVLIDQAYAMSM